MFIGGLSWDTTDGIYSCPYRIHPPWTNLKLFVSLPLSLYDLYGPSRRSEEILHAVWQGDFYYDLARVVSRLYSAGGGMY